MPWNDLVMQNLSPNRALPWFYLPSVTVIATSLTIGMPTDWPQWALPTHLPPRALPTTSTLTHLELHHTNIDPAILGYILISTPALERLGCQFFYPAWGRDQKRGLDCAALREALLHVATTLKHMSLDIRYYFNGSRREHVWAILWHSWAMESEEHDVTGQIGSLFEFPKLEAVAVPVAILLGRLPASALELADVVPSTVRTVELRGNLSESEEQWIHPV